MTHPSSKHCCVGLDALHVAALGLIQNAQRDIYIMTPDLEPARLNRADLALALSVFARSSRYTRVHILISSADRLVLGAHALLQLHRRMPSQIQIRQVQRGYVNASREHADHDQQMLIDARHRLVIDTQHKSWSGTLCVDDIPYARQQAERFESLWQQAQLIKDLQYLGL